MSPRQRINKRDLSALMVLIGIWTSVTWFMWIPNLPLGFTYGFLGSIIGLTGAWYLDHEPPLTEGRQN